MNEYTNKFFKRELIEYIHCTLNIPRTTIDSVINRYVEYLKGKLESGQSVKFLNVCYLKVKSDTEDSIQETLAYTAVEVGKQLKVSGQTAIAILFALEEAIINSCSVTNSVRGTTIRGLVRIKMEGDNVRIKKSTAYNGFDIYITTLQSFRRRVETENSWYSGDAKAVSAT